MAITTSFSYFSQIVGLRLKSFVRDFMEMLVNNWVDISKLFFRNFEGNSRLSAPSMPSSMKSSIFSEDPGLMPRLTYDDWEGLIMCICRHQTAAESRLV